MISKTKLAKLKEIAKKYELGVLILFGSRASNDSRDDSDWDFAYFADKPLKEKKKEIWGKVEDIFSPCKIDLIELNTTYSIILRNEIFTKGICVYEKKKGLFSDLEGNAWIDYQDNKAYFKECKAILKESISEL